MEETTPQGSAIFNAVKGVMGLFDNINKAGTAETQTIKAEDEYSSKFTDDEIITLKKAWVADYTGYYTDIEKSQKLAFEYWLGKQKVDTADSLEGRDIVINKIFEAVETFLPIATRANPDPLVSADNSPEGQALANDVKEALSFQADEQKLRRKLARMARHWIINRIGVIEVDYDIEIDDIKTSVIQPKRLIFDKDGHVDESGIFQGEYIGIRYKITASKLIKMFPEKKTLINTKAMFKKGTKLEYIKWWYRGTDVFFTLDNDVLGKFKNPHWNYDGMISRIDPETRVDVGEFVQGKNHLKKPTAMLVFLTVFNTGIQPHDDTSLILQNITQQNQINKRARQLDANIDSQNNGIAVDGRVMTQEQAAQAASAKRRGASIRVMGNPNEVLSTMAAPQLPSDVWHALDTAKADLANIFGTSGSTPSGIQGEESARGKILVNQLDASRIGGGVTEYIEQVADTIYNFWVQMMFVHYDEPHYINSIGEQQGTELMAIVNTRFTKTLNVTVKEGSLIPKDPLTQRNEAMDLWSAGAIDPMSLYKKLDFPDPNQATENLIKWQMLQKGMIPPEMYLPSFNQGQPTPMGGLPQPQGVGGPAVNAPTGQEIQNPVGQGTQTAAGIQSKQLMGAVPLQ